MKIIHDGVYSLRLIMLACMMLPIIINAQTTSQFASGWSTSHNPNWTPAPPSANPLGAADDNCTGGIKPAGDSYAEFTFAAFGIPAGDILNGIEVKAKYRTSSGPNVQLTSGGTLVGNQKTMDAADVTSNCASTVWKMIGGSGDLWGTSLTAADFNAGTVGVRLSITANNLDLDAIELIAHHSPANSPPNCSGAMIAVQSADGSCQAAISGTDVSGVTDPDGDALTITVDPTTLMLGSNTVSVEADDGKGGTCNTTIMVHVIDDTDPTIGCPGNLTVDNDPGQCGADVFWSLTVSDNCPGVTVDCSPSGSFFGIGSTEVCCTATDAAGNTASCCFTVTVNDTEDPTIVCPANIEVDNDPGLCGAVVNYSAPIIQDNCPGATVVCSPASGSFFDVGTTAVCCTVTDASGNTSSCCFDITVNDVEPPVITTIDDQIVLWPPDHDYHLINVSDCVTDVMDNCDDLSVSDVTVKSVSSDEPEDAKGGGDGHTEDDIVIGSGCQSVDLRSERQGDGNGRVYTIVFSVTDEAGNEGTVSCQVTVPPNQGGAMAVDDGAAAGYTTSCAGSSRLRSEFDLENSEPVHLADFVLSQNQPNPFSDFTNIYFSVPDASLVNLTIYDLNGRLIRILHSGHTGLGQQRAAWDGTKSDGVKVDNGVYLYRLQSSGFTECRKLLLIR